MEHLSIGSNMVKDRKNLSKDIHIRELTKMVDLTDLVHINGKILHFIKEVSKTVLDMEKASGS